MPFEGTGPAGDGTLRRWERKIDRFGASGTKGAEQREQTREENEQICCIWGEGRRAEGAEGMRGQGQGLGVE